MPKAWRQARQGAQQARTQVLMQFPQEEIHATQGEQQDSVQLDRHSSQQLQSNFPQWQHAPHTMHTQQHRQNRSADPATPPTMYQTYTGMSERDIVEFEADVVPEVSVGILEVDVVVPEVGGVVPEVDAVVPEVNLGVPEVDVVPDVSVGVLEVDVVVSEVGGVVPEADAVVPEISVGVPEVDVVPEVVVGVGEVVIGNVIGGMQDTPAASLSKQKRMNPDGHSSKLFSLPVHSQSRTQMFPAPSPKRSAASV